MAGILEHRAEAAVASGDSFATTLKRTLIGMLARREDDCHPQANVNLCEKPGMSSKTITWIVVGVVLGLLLFGTFAVLIYFHIRKTKRDKREDLEDRYQMADYGLDELPAARKPRPDDEVKSPDGSPTGYGRRSREPLHGATEPKYQNGQLNGHLNPFDETPSLGSNGTNPAWPKREGSQPSPLGKGA